MRYCRFNFYKILQIPYRATRKVVANQMKALVYEGPRQMRIHDYPECSPLSGEVKIKVAYCGICGSDLHGYTGASGRKIPPMVMGHEFSGVIAEIGEGVTQFKVGDRVSVLPVEYCGECEFCKEGSVNICKNRRNLGVLDVDGAMTEYICVKEKLVYRLPDQVSLEEGALLEPLSVAFHAVRKAQPVQGKNVLIAGTGTIGLLIVMLMKEAGAKAIIVTDLNDTRLKLAQKFGAQLAINPAKQDLEQCLVEAGIRDHIHLGVECVGATPTCQQTITYVKTQGRIIWVGNAAKMVNIDMQKIVTQELSIQGTYAFTDNDFTGALHLLEGKKIPASEIITGIVPLEKATETFDALVSGDNPNIKVLVDISSVSE